MEHKIFGLYDIRSWSNKGSQIKSAVNQITSFVIPLHLSQKSHELTNKKVKMNWNFIYIWTFVVFHASQLKILKNPEVSLM